MCEPTTISLTIAALGAAASAATIIGNNKAVQGQLTGAGNAQQADYNALAAQRGEIEDGATGASLAVQAEARRARATLIVAQGESDLVGPTQLRERADARQAEKANLATIEANRATANAQLERNLVNVDISAAGRMNEANSKVLGNFASGLQITGAAAGGAITGYKASKEIFPTKAPPRK